jgi:hypothetical protein
VSSITTHFLSWCCQKLQAAGKKVWVLIWDNASWHISTQVKIVPDNAIDPLVLQHVPEKGQARALLAWRVSIRIDQPCAVDSNPLFEADAVPA